MIRTILEWSVKIRDKRVIRKRGIVIKEIITDEDIILSKIFSISYLKVKTLCFM